MNSFKKFLSAILAIIMLATSTSVSFLSFAADEKNDFDLQIYYYDENKNFVEVTQQVQVEEQKDVKLYACLVYSDGTVWDMSTSGMPIGMEGYTVDWTSDARYLAFCEKNDGVIHGYDATKGEAIRNWINNEVATIPVVGETLAKAILAALENGSYDIDDLDTEDVIKIVNGLLDTLNLSQYKEQLGASIKEYLDKYDVGITATLKNAEGNAVASDTVRVLVTKASNLLSDVVPNAAFIKNYDSIPTTVAVGYEMDLQGIITPVRTHYDCEWTVTGQYGVIENDKIATVDETGHFVAIGEGTVQVKVSPDVKGMTKKLKEAFEALSKAGDLVDNETIAKAVLLILGIKGDTDNYTTLVNIITKILESGVTVDGSLTFTEETMSPLVNFILYVIYQDSIKINVVKPSAIPVTSYEIAGDTKIDEGETRKLSFTNVKPDGAVPHDYKIYIENEEYVVQTEPNSLSVLGIDGSTWYGNYVAPNKTNLVVEMCDIKKSTELSIYGKDNKKIVYIKIGCDEYLPVDTIVNVDAVTYPKRLAPNLSYGWINEDGSYNFATAEAPAYSSDGFCYVTSSGVLYATGCTVNQLVVMDSNGATATKQIMSGIQTTGVKFDKKHFWKKGESGTISTGIRGAVCEVSATIQPYNASFNKLTFTSSNTESVILSATPLTTASYSSASLTEARRKNYASATVECDENGKAKVYAYAIGNSATYANVTVKTETGGFSDVSTVAYANISVTDVVVTSAEDELYLQEDGTYLVTAGDTVNFSAKVNFDQAGSWKNQGFEDVEWSVSDSYYASINESGIFKALDVGTIDVTAISVFGEVPKSVSVRILPNYNELKAAMANSNYESLDPYDWSVKSWELFDSLYKEADEKIENNLFNSQREVDELTQKLIDAFNGLVRYMPLEALEIACNDDADGNGFATISVKLLSNYTDYSTKINATVYPLEAQDYTVVYTSSNPDLVSVDKNGICKPVLTGDAAYAKITVEVTDPKNGNSFKKEMYVAFAKYQVAEVSVNPTSFTFVGVGEYAINKETTITPSYKTSSVGTPSITRGFFVSSNEQVAKVNDDGVVTPVGLGSATIILYAYDGGYTATTEIKVTTNKNDLSSAINQANALVEEFYTPETYFAVMTSLAAAKDVMNNEAATQEEVNASADDLKDKLSKLEKNPYANVYLAVGEGGSVVYDGESYKGKNNKVSVLIENGMTVKAVADEGYAFVKWLDANGNTISTNPEETFAIDYSAGYEAVFEKVYAVTGVKIFADGNDTDYYTKNVSFAAVYTNQKIAISSTVYPSNANFYELSYSSSNGEVVIENGVAKPSENQTCYAYITVTVRNTLTGETFSDKVCVVFAKYALDSVTPSTDVLSFSGVDSASQKIDITYNSANSSTPSLRRGFFASQNESIARVDNEGNVSPVSIGTTQIIFTAYDGGKQATVKVNVYADKSALQTAINNASVLKEINFSQESFALMQIALEKANEINAIEFASQEQVDSATTELEEAINALEKLDLLDYTVNIEGEGYVMCDGALVDGSVSLLNGTTVTFAAVPAKDYEFIGWYDVDGNELSASKSYPVTITSFDTITAKFAKIAYVESINLTVDGELKQNKTVNVGATRNYTAYKITLGSIVYPTNARNYNIEYYLGADCNNLSLNSNVVVPSSNDIAYGTVYVKVTDTLTKESFVDSCVVCFSKYGVGSISLDSSALLFNGENAPSQNVNVTYNSSGALKSSVRRGYITIEDSSIADVSTSIGDNGTYAIITPKKIGTTTATFTSYDSGHSQSFTITVYANKDALNSVIAEALALNGENYTPETFQAVQPVLEYAIGVKNTQFAQQADVDLATNSLRNVLDSLVLADILKISAMSTDNGTTTINGESVDFVKIERGESITLNAIADTGYMLDGWYKDGIKVSESTVYTFNPEEPVSFVAKFVPIPFVEKIVLTQDGVETDFANADVALVYTNYSINLGLNVYPSTAKYTVLSYEIGENSNNLALDGSIVKPSSNAAAYGQIVATVRDEYSGNEYKDVIYVSFARYKPAGVSVSPTSMTFASPNSPSQTITPTFTNTSSTRKANITVGVYMCSDERVAKVNQYGVVTPVGKGSCTITCYSYDGEKNATTSVTVNGNPTITGKVVLMASPNNDSGTVGLEGAVVTVGTKSAVTSSDGSFVIEDVEASNTATVSYKYGITRTVHISNSSLGNIAIVACDTNHDGYINAKDYVRLRKDNNENLLTQFNEFYGSAKYSSNLYK